MYTARNIQFPTCALMPEGRIMRTGAGWHWEYHLRDHLGNTRLTIADTAGRGVAVVLQNTHYYPFGMSIATLSHTTAGHANPWLYNGKEHQPDFDLGWYDYGARFYDAEVARWSSIDPAYDLYYSWSPYHYVRNNPIKLSDPNGMWDDGYEDGNGNYVWFDDRKEDQFTDKDGTTWSKVTENEDSWDEAIVIREAVIDLLVQNDYDESSLRQNISLVGDSESDLFNKEVFAETAITGGIVTDKSKWDDGVLNSGGEEAFQTKNDINGYDVKCYPDKNGEHGPFMTIVTSNTVIHTIDAIEAYSTDNNVNFRNAFMFLKDSKGGIEGMTKTLLRYDEHFYKDYKK